VVCVCKARAQKASDAQLSPSCGPAKDACPSDQASICGVGMLIITAVHIEITDMDIELTCKVAMLEAAQVCGLIYHVCPTARDLQAPGACGSARYVSTSESSCQMHQVAHLFTRTVRHASPMPDNSPR
jgi:hypothetical protein